jgi:hypothetical protein
MPIRANPKLKYVSLSELLSYVTFGVFKPYTDISFNSGRSEDFELIVKFNEQLDEAKRDIFSALRDGHLFGRGRFSRTKVSSAPNWKETYWHEYEIAKTDIDPDFWSEFGIDWKSSSAKNPGGEFVDIVFSTDDIFGVWPPETAIVSSNSVPASDRVVSLGHNSEPFEEALASLDKVIEDLKASPNDLGTITAEERIVVLSNLEHGRKLFSAPQISVAAFAVFIKSTLIYVANAAAQTAIGAAALKALELFGMIPGLI